MSKKISGKLLFVGVILFSCSIFMGCSNDRKAMKIKSIYTNYGLENTEKLYSIAITPRNYKEINGLDFDEGISSVALSDAISNNESFSFEEIEENDWLEDIPFKLIMRVVLNDIKNKTSRNIVYTAFVQEKTNLPKDEYMIQWRFISENTYEAKFYLGKNKRSETVSEVIKYDYHNEFDTKDYFDTEYKITINGIENSQADYYKYGSDKLMEKMLGFYKKDNPKKEILEINKNELPKYLNMGIILINLNNDERKLSDYGIYTIEIIEKNNPTIKYCAVIRIFDGFYSEEKDYVCIVE